MQQRSSSDQKAQPGKSALSNAPLVRLAGYNNASETKKHDADAVRYLSYVLYPLLAGYAVYALCYETHKSWYSFILNTLVGAVYMFGFILMCPQVNPLFSPRISSSYLLPPPACLQFDDRVLLCVCCVIRLSLTMPSVACCLSSCLPILSETPHH